MNRNSQLGFDNPLQLRHCGGVRVFYDYSLQAVAASKSEHHGDELRVAYVLDLRLNVKLGLYRKYLGVKLGNRMWND